jgi:dienelactone hydrolase
MKKIIVLLLFSVSVQAQQLNHLSYGSYGVGFHSSLEFDFSRPSRNKNQFGRAVQINIWYPAKSKKGRAMDIKEYIYLIGNEDSVVVRGQNNAAALKSFLSFPLSQGASADSWSAFLSSVKSMKAFRDAVFNQGDYPVVQLIHGSAANYSVLGEFLASHGMVVINVPDKGYLQSSIDVNVLGMETEMRDQEFAFDFLVKKFNFRPTQLGLVGYSFGGQSAVGLGVRNPLVKGIVSLDGGIGSSFGPQLLAGHPFYSVEKVKMPIVHLYNPMDTGGNVDWFEVAEFNDRYLVAFKNMTHDLFGIFGAVANELNAPLGPEHPKSGSNYEAILLYTLSFFKEVFNTGHYGEATFLDVEKKNLWVGNGIMFSAFKKKKYDPLPYSHWESLLYKQGLDAFETAYAKQKSETVMPITDETYRSLFLVAFRNNEKQISMKIAEHYKGDFPSSALAHYYCGRSIQLNDQVDVAKPYFSLCLKLISSDATLTPAEKEAIRQRAEEYLKN